MVTGSLHEQFERPETPLPSDRSTGLVFAVVALTVAYIWRTTTATVLISCSVASLLVAISFLRPSILRPLNVAWMRFALVLSHIMNPIVMFVLFAVAIVPAGLAMQLVRDPLRRRKGEANTHWIPVENDARTTQSSMKNQF